MNKKIAILIGIIAISAFCVGGVVSPFKWIFPQIYKEETIINYVVAPNNYDNPGITFKVDSYIWDYRDGILIYYYEHSGVVTNIGRNFTAAKLLGNKLSWTQTSAYSANLTAISFGNGAAPGVTGTQLPSEITRNTTCVYTFISSPSKFNMTAVLHPSSSGTLNCTGINWQTSGSGNLFCYDMYAPLSYTSADTITIRWQVYVNYQ